MKVTTKNYTKKGIVVALIIGLGGCASVHEQGAQDGQVSTQSDQKFYATYAHLHGAMAVMHSKLPEMKWKGIVAVSRGGFFPALYLAHRLSIKNIEVLALTSYGDDKKKGSLYLLQPFDFQSKNQGEGWLVIDELSDSGATLAWIRQRLPKAHFAVIYAKPKGMTVVDTYGATIAQDTWIEFPWE